MKIKFPDLAIGTMLLGLSTMASAQLINTDPVLIDWNGGGDSFEATGSLDWFFSSSLATGAIDVTTTYTYVDSDGNTQTITQAQIFTTPELISTGTTLTCVSNCSFNIYNHATLSNASDPDGNPTFPIDGSFEWTYIFGAEESINTQVYSQSTNGTVELDLVGDDGVTETYTRIDVTSTLNFQGAQNTDTGGDGQSRDEGFFFEIYYDDNPNADALSGDGFDDGILVLEADTLYDISGNFSALQFAFADVNGDGEFTIGVDVTLVDLDNVFVYQALDSFGADNWADAGTVDCGINANGDTCYTVEGEGATTLDALVLASDINPDFIKAIGSFELISELAFSTENVDPFEETNPSGCYSTSAGGTTNDCEHVFGSLVNEDGSISADVINGGGTTANCVFALDPTTCFTSTTAGEDILFQTDANSAFRTVTRQVPEPGTLALLGAGLGFLGMRNRRKRTAI